MEEVFEKVPGPCENPSEGGITWEDQMEIDCSWKPNFIKNFPGCENVTCPSEECDDD